MANQKDEPEALANLAAKVPQEPRRARERQLPFACNPQRW